MNPLLTTVGAVVAVANVASTAYYYAEHFGVFNRESKVEAETRSVEVLENQSADVGLLLGRIPVFHGSGYEIWSSMMKTLFLSQDLWDMVEGGYIEEELSIEVFREVRKKDAMALLFIQQAIDESVFSCIAGASKSKEAWDALQKKYQLGDDALEPNPVDLSCPADAWDAPEQVVEANRIGEEFGDFNNNCGFNEGCSSNSDSGCGGGRDDWHFKMSCSEDGIGKESRDIKNNNSGFKKGFRGISNRGGRGGRNCGRFNNNQGGTDNGDFNNNSHGGRGGQGRGHINNNWGGRGGKGRGHINNKRGGRGGKDHGHSNNNQGDCRGTGSGCFKKQGGRGGLDDGCFNGNKGISGGGIDNGHFNKSSEAEAEAEAEAADYNSKNAKSESTSSCTTSATETKEALDAHALQQGQQANTEVLAQVRVGNPSGGSIFIKNLDKAIDDRALHAIFSEFGNILSCKVETDASGESKGYGHMEYDSEEAAQEAIEKVNGMLWNHKKVYVEPFIRKQDRAKAREMTNFTNVFVGNLSLSTTQEDLREVFGHFGTIVSVVVMKDGDGKSEGFGFVNFDDADDATWSMEVLNGHKFDNKEWYVRRAYQKKFVGKAQKKSVVISVPSSTAKATQSKKSGDAVAHQKKSVDESVPSSTANETESKKAVELKQYKRDA